MDKKILLSGAAALIVGTSFMFATPASANITFSHSGEANIIATFKDTCAVQADKLDSVDSQDDPVDGASDPAATQHAIANFLGFTYIVDDDDSTDYVGEAQSVAAGIDNIMGGGVTIGDDADLNADIVFVDNSCTGNAENPLWTTDSSLDWSAGGTLANGLGVSISDSAAITLSGAFGSVTWEDGGDSAAKKSFVGGDGDLDKAGGGWTGHALATDGTAGMVVTYAAPSMGGMDLFVSYAPNSDGGNGENAIDTDAGAYTDTIGVGLSFGMDALTISAGWESATHNGGTNACDWDANVTIDAETNEQIAASDLIDTVYGTDECGDQTLTVIGASMSVSGLAIDAGWSKLDTEEADRTTLTANLGMTAGDYNISLGYVDATRSSLIAGSDSSQTTIAGTISTSLGDGVDLGLTLSNNKWDDDSQATSRNGAGATNDFQAIGKLTVLY